jgi:hypothetical protein
MCVSCGCGAGNDDHGNPANITEQDVQRAADAAGISTAEAADNIHDALCPSGTVHSAE